MFNAADGAPTDCVPQHLFGCAGLAESDDVYDIACAGCVDGPRADTDRFDLDAAVCFGECFVNECYTVLGGS